MATPQGWYGDPQDPNTIRWWDGQQWTEHAKPKPPVPAAPAQPSQPVAPAVPPAGSFKAAKPKLFGRGQALDEAHAEIARLQGELTRLGAMDIADLQAERERLQAQVAAVAQQVAEETAILQEAGVYRYQHPLDDSVAYRAELSRIQDQIKAMVKKDGGAITATTTWNVNGSATEGRKMVNDISKLMLRAYNAEAGNLVRGMKPYKLQSAKDRLDKVAMTIEKPGRSMSIRVSPAYHQLRWRELELTADYLEKVAEEKERDREERERLRDERKVEQEIERERQRLRKEEQHFRQAIAQLAAKGNTDGVERLQAQLEGVIGEIEAVDFRARTLTAGHVYVISNIDSFGEGVLKIGMTAAWSRWTASRSSVTLRCRSSSTSTRCTSPRTP